MRTPIPNDKKPGCLGAILQLFSASPNPESTLKAPKAKTLPYRLRDDFLSFAELSFYHILRQAVSDWAVICPKVSLKDLFYAKGGQWSNPGYISRIDRKHVDFVLCHPQTMRPLLGIELDDSSHQKASRQERDRFVEQVFTAAGLPLFRQAVHATYNVRELAVMLKQMVEVKGTERNESATSVASPSKVSAQRAITPVTDKRTLEHTASVPAFASNTTPHCPQCGELMALRTVKKEGPNKGNKFWGCKDYPRCRGVRPYTET